MPPLYEAAYGETRLARSVLDDFIIRSALFFYVSGVMRIRAYLVTNTIPVVYDLDIVISPCTVLYVLLLSLVLGCESFRPT